MKNTNADIDETVMKNKKAAAKSDMKIKEKNRQIVTVTAAEAAIITMTKINTEIKRAMSFRFKKNIRLLVVTQMMLKILFIFQMSLLCFHVNQSDIRQNMFLSHDNIHYYMCQQSTSILHQYLIYRIDLFLISITVLASVYYFSI